jgi:hypothetical protein
MAAATMMADTMAEATVGDTKTTKTTHTPSSSCITW